MDRLIAPNTVPVGSGDVAPSTGTPGQATDGNPATNTPATRFPAYAFNAIQEELMAVFAAAGLSPNRANNGQLAQAIPLLAKATGDARYALISNLLGASSIPTISVATTLTANSAGKHHVFSAGVAATMPAASSLSAGQAISFQSLVSGASVVRAGTDVITTGSSSVTSLALNAGDTLTLMSNGTNGWYAVGGSVSLGSAGIFAQTNGPNGFKKLPGGLIWQWGTNAGTTSGTASYSFPIAFTASIFNMQALVNNTSAAAHGRVTYASLTTFSVGAYRTDSATWTTDPVFWQAIGI